MTITVDPYTIPTKGKVDIHVERSFEIKITAEEAQKQVNRWLLNEVSYLMHSLPPTLVIGEQQVVWRVPASFSAPDVGQVGLIGTIDVDVETGDMSNTDEQQTALIQRAEELAARLPPYQPKQNIPTEYLAKKVPPSPSVTIN